MKTLLALVYVLSMVLTSAESDPAAAIVGVVLLLVIMVAGAFFYFLPSVIAIFRGHYNWGAIAVVNVFFGWTFVGWVIALAWSVTGQKK